MLISRGRKSTIQVYDFEIVIVAKMMCVIYDEFLTFYSVLLTENETPCVLHIHSISTGSQRHPDANGATYRIRVACPI